MTEYTNEPNETGEGTTPAADENFGWSPEPEVATRTGGQAREWLVQLQAMIEDLATQAAPVIREVGAKAAELAAIAGDKAGPAAQRAAEFTGQAGQKLAERSRGLANELRRDAAMHSDTPAPDEPVTADEPPTTASVA